MVFGKGNKMSIRNANTIGTRLEARTWGRAFII
jgi:hypothetical protein